MKYLSVFYLVIVLLFGCKETKNSSEILQRFDHPNDTTFKRETPARDYPYVIDKYKEQQLHLENIENGFETIQIRLWIDDELAKGRELYVIKNTNGNWKGEAYKMMTERRIADQSDSITSKEVKTAVPKSGWDYLFNKLIQLKIETLPDMTKIPGIKDGFDDGAEFNIEIASKYNYRYYSYHVPGEFKDKFWQAKNMTEIVKVIRSELNP